MNLVSGELLYADLLCAEASAMAVQPAPDDPAAGRFCGREHLLPLRVYYEDTDVSGVVYHANHVRYLERGRSEFLRQAGASHSDLIGGRDPMTFSIVALKLNWRRCARVDDKLVVRTMFDAIRGARIITRQIITRGNEVILEADTEAACISLDGRPRRPSQRCRDALAPWLLQPCAF